MEITPAVHLYFESPQQETFRDLYTFPKVLYGLGFTPSRDDFPVSATEKEARVFGRPLELTELELKLLLYILSFGGIHAGAPVNRVVVRQTLARINIQVRSVLADIGLPKNFELIKQRGQARVISMASVVDMHQKISKWHKKVKTARDRQALEQVSVWPEPILEAVKVPVNDTTAEPIKANTPPTDKDKASEIVDKDVVAKRGMNIEDYLDIDKSQADWLVTIKATGISQTITPYAWNKTTIDLLKLLWEYGLTTQIIGEALGVSKNAVVGKAHRENLPPRSSPIIRDATGQSRDERIDGRQESLANLKTLTEAIHMQKTDHDFIRAAAKVSRHSYSLTHDEGFGKQRLHAKDVIEAWRQQVGCVVMWLREDLGCNDAYAFADKIIPRSEPNDIDARNNLVSALSLRLNKIEIASEVGSEKLSIETLVNALQKFSKLLNTHSQNARYNSIYSEISWLLENAPSDENQNITSLAVRPQDRQMAVNTQAALAY